MAKIPTTKELWASILENANKTGRSATSGSDLKRVGQETSIISRETSTNRSAAVKFTNTININPIDASDLATLTEDDLPSYVTRHIDERYLMSGLSGYFQFGTTESYRAKDIDNVGRLGDTTEARQIVSFYSKNPTTNISTKNIEIIGDTVYGDMAHYVQETRVNDYCSCSSNDKFNLQRAKTLKEKGNGDLGAFITYDLKMLIQALREIAMNDYGLSLVIRKVTYDHKDIRHDFQGHLDLKKDSTQEDALRIWLEASFFKPEFYQHEDELRILLVDPNKLGALPHKSPILSFTDARVQSAIVNSGKF